MTRASEFWDDVFTHNRREWVADKSAEELIAILALAGPFAADLAAARSVLDVGPGEARLLKRCVAEGKQAEAIEVSAVNRTRLAWADIYVEHLCTEGIDLAWSLSCFPHNDYPTQRALLREVYDRLRPGGVFYLEGVERAPGAPEAPEGIKLPAGRYTVTLDELTEWPEYKGFYQSSAVLREFGAGCPVVGWIARLVKLPVDGRTTLLDVLRERDAATGDVSRSLRERADALYESLTPREREVYAARFGARDDKEKP